MHLRKTKTNNGRIYLAIVDSFYDKQKKCPVTKQLNLWDILMFSKKNTMIQLLTSKKELSS